MIPKPIFPHFRALRRWSFTLIELLVSITIISLLAAMLVPTISSAKARARDVQCASNMKQIHLAIMLYANDHDQVYPVLSGPVGNSQQTDQILLFSNSVPQLEVFHCPLQTTTNGSPSVFVTNISGNPVYTSYKMNDDTYQLMGRKVGNQDRPERVVYLIDSMEWVPRHRDAMENVCFADGHIEMMTQAQFWGPEPGRSAPWNWFRWGLYEF